jgi:hypothetical protein
MKSVLPIIAAALAVVATPATAATFFTTTLSGAKETVPNASTATGFGNLTLSDDNNSISLLLSWTGLNGGPATGAHIHCCALPGANGPVAIDFGPPALTTGSVTRTYDLTLLGTYSGGFLSANGGTAVSARAALLAGLTSGRTYFNVHNAQFPGGEIRGQLVAVPEAATWGMMIVGFGIVGGTMRTRRREALAT